MESIWIDTANTQKVLKLFRKYDSRPVIVKNIKDLESDPNYFNLASYLGVKFSERDRLLIYIDIENVEVEIVHEMLHEIMKYEGFPIIRFNNYIYNKLPKNHQEAVKNIRNRFASTLDHLELYRRINEDYNFNLEKYYSRLYDVKYKRFKNVKKTLTKDQYIFREQQHILEGLDYFSYIDPYKTKILKKFEQTYNRAFKSCNLLYTNISDIGFRNPKQLQEVAFKIQYHIIEYGESKYNNIIINMIWKALLFVSLK